MTCQWRAPIAPSVSGILEDFAREQVLSLVRRVFFANSDRPARQIVFSAVERNIDVVRICDQVAAALAKQTVEHVAVVDGDYRATAETCIRPSSLRSASIKSRSSRIAANLWRVPKSVAKSATDLELDYIGFAGWKSYETSLSLWSSKVRPRERRVKPHCWDN